MHDPLPNNSNSCHKGQLLHRMCIEIICKLPKRMALLEAQATSQQATPTIENKSGIRVPGSELVMPVGNRKPFKHAVGVTIKKGMFSRLRTLEIPVIGIHGGKPRYMVGNPDMVGSAHIFWPGQQPAGGAPPSLVCGVPTMYRIPPCIWLDQHVFRSIVSSINYQVSCVSFCGRGNN